MHCSLNHIIVFVWRLWIFFCCILVVCIFTMLLPCNGFFLPLFVGFYRVLWIFLWHLFFYSAVFHVVRWSGNWNWRSRYLNELSLFISQGYSNGFYLELSMATVQLGTWIYGYYPIKTRKKKRCNKHKWLCSKVTTILLTQFYQDNWFTLYGKSFLSPVFSFTEKKTNIAKWKPANTIVFIVFISRCIKNINFHFFLFFVYLLPLMTHSHSAQ